MSDAFWLGGVTLMLLGYLLLALVAPERFQP